jgi:hypothetical protein
MQSYEAFWENLIPAYPVSKGAMRLPIVAELQTLSNLDVSQMMSDLKTVLEQLLWQSGAGAGARARAKAAGETSIIPYIDDTYTGVVRFDCVLNEAGEIKILELNADYPDGLLLHDYTYSALSGTSSKLHEKAFLKFFPPDVQIHISHAADAHFLDAYHLEKKSLEAAGHAVTIGSPVAGVLPAWHRRCIEASKIVAEDMSWCEESNPQHLNSFTLRTLGYKDLLATISHPSVLKTIVLSAENLSEIVADRERYVLKPANGCEGRGILFGRDYASAEWAVLLAQLPAGYVAQEYVTLPRLKVPIYEAGEIIYKELFFDICPHFFIHEGKVVDSGHILMRFSESAIVNVSQGGAVGYHTLR